jgi:predicted O-methyltransferase YrrM
LRRGFKLFRERGLIWLLTELFAYILPLRVMANLLLTVLNSTLLRDLICFVNGIHTNQLWHERSNDFERIIAIEVSKPKARVMEIGTWFGAGSTRLILKHLAHDGLFYSVDSWSAKEYLGLSGHPSKSARRMATITQSAWLSSASRLFRHQKIHQNANLIQIRVDSKDLSELFNPEMKFDIIYIDGSHVYEDILSDLEFAIRHTRPEGLICGDDLDLGLAESYLDLALENLEMDLVVLSDGTAFHPGVLLALSKKFKKVNSSNGFWWVRV